jgi:hypothetical protein
MRAGTGIGLRLLPVPRAAGAAVPARREPLWSNIRPDGIIRSDFLL